MRGLASTGPLQQDHAALHSAAAHHAADTAQRWRPASQRHCRGGRWLPPAAVPPAAAAAETEAWQPQSQQQSLQALQQQNGIQQPILMSQEAAGLQLALGTVPDGGGGTTLNLALPGKDGDIVGYLSRQYKLYDRRQVRGKAARALAALQVAQPGAEALSLQRDVLPKLQLLEALSPGLGWKVFRQFPEEFVSPEAVERWRVAAAYLFTVGIPPEQISALFTRHAVLFRSAVARPDNLRLLFTWLGRDLALPPEALLKLLNRCPAVLQADVQQVLKPRLAFFTNDLGLTQERALTGVMRCPEVLGVATPLLAAKAAFFTGQLGMTPAEVGALYVREPAALLSSLSRLQDTVAWLRDGLGLSPGVLRRVVAKGGATKYPLATLQERVALWQRLGFTPAELHQLLDACPRLLLYPAAEPKYQAKLRFLTEEIGLPLRALLAYPSYISYSLPARIAPRAAAARALADRHLPLGQLAPGDEAFARWLGMEVEEWEAWQAAWQQGPEALRWTEASVSRSAAAAVGGSVEERRGDEAAALAAGPAARRRRGSKQAALKGQKRQQPQPQGQQLKEQQQHSDGGPD